MSERVSSIIFTKNDCDSTDELYAKVGKQLKILIEAGYNAFVNKVDQKGNVVKIEFCVADPSAKRKDVPQPCWLFLDELEYLSHYQLQSIINEAADTIRSIQQEEKPKEEKPKRKIKKKDGDA